MSNRVRAILQIDEAKDETDSGLLLTSSSKEQPTIGKVCLSACQWVSRQGHMLQLLSCMTTHKSNCSQVCDHIMRVKSCNVHLQVIAVGSGKEDDKGAIVKPNLNKGDTVLYSRYSGTEFAQEEKQYIVIRELDVLACVQ